MSRALSQLRKRPDIVLIYSGHNEFWSRYPATRVVNPGVFDPAALLRVSPILGRLLAIREQNQIDSAHAAPAERRLIDQAAYTPEEFQQRLEDFHRQLQGIVRVCERGQIMPVLIIPPANDAGYEPNRSILPSSMTDEQRTGFERRFLEARSAETNPLEAIERYRALIADQPGFAEAHFRLGRLLLEQGSTVQANEQFALARDTDAYAIRCPTPFQDVYRELAASSGAVLIDGPAELRAVNPHGVLDFNLFHDAHHPSFLGHVALAEAVLRELRQHEALGWNSGPVPTVDRAECAQHFSIDGSAWQGVCSWATGALDYGAGLRFDGADRHAWARRFQAAAHAMAGGTAPEETKLPGLGVACPWYPPAQAGPAAPTVELQPDVPGT